MRTSATSRAQASRCASSAAKLSNDRPATAFLELVRKLGFRYVSVGQHVVVGSEPEAEILRLIGRARAVTGVA
jgi:hypothetical protein